MKRLRHAERVPQDDEGRREESDVRCLVWRAQSCKEVAIEHVVRELEQELLEGKRSIRAETGQGAKSAYSKDKDQGLGTDFAMQDPVADIVEKLRVVQDYQ